MKEAVEKIRQFYRTGANLPGKTAHKVAYNKRVVEGLAERNGVSDTKIRQARQFAASYSPEELEELCGLVERIQPGQEAYLPVFGLTHVIRLLSVRPKRRRQALQRKAIEQGWSCRELEAEIAKKFGTRRDGGRRRKIPSALEDFLVQAEELCEEWRRWHEELSRKADDVGGEHVVLDGLPEKISNRIRVASKAIRGLHEEVVEELKQQLPDRKLRSAFRANEKDSGASSAKK